LWALLGSNPRPGSARSQRIGHRRRAGPEPGGRRDVDPNVTNEITVGPASTTHPCSSLSELPTDSPKASLPWALLGSDDGPLAVRVVSAV
jgi:hypothetical protein